MIKKKMVTLNPGESKVVAFEVIPTVPRAYQVSVDGLMGSFVATEIPKAEFYMPAVMTVVVTDGSILGIYWGNRFSCAITNKGNISGTFTLTGRDNLGRGGTWTITLAPGESYTWSVFYYIDFRRISAPYVWELWGDWEGDNYSIGRAYP